MIKNDKDFAKYYKKVSNNDKYFLESHFGLLIKNVLPPKVSSILKENGYIEYETYGPIKLTKEGENLAKKILEAYDIVYLFLTGSNLDLRNYIDESKNKVIINPFLVLPRYSTIFTELDEYIEDNYPAFNRVLW